MVSRLNLSRDQLATFLKDHEQIKQFERLFGAVDDMAGSGGDALQINIGSAQASAAALLAQLQAIADGLNHEPPQADTSGLEARLEALEALPPAVPFPVVQDIYTPTLTNVANLDASTAYQCQYCRVGDMVTVTGKVDVDPTAAVATQLGLSLPIASNLGAPEQCAGTAFAPGIAGQGAAILGDVANDRAQMQWVAVDLTNQAMYFTFSYRVL